jgi:hypothetical protein
MIVTKRYQVFGNILKTVVGNKVFNILFHNVSNQVIKLHKNAPGNILSTSNITKRLPEEYQTESYENLYNTYYSIMDEEELSRLIDDFLEEFKNKGEYTNFHLLRTYLYALFIGGWSQLVEHVYKSKNEKEDIYYIGAKSDMEYKVLNSIQHSISSSIFSISVKRILSDRILELFGKGLIFLKRRKEVNGNRLLTSYSKIKGSKPAQNKKRNIVISILEERRFARIAELHRELKNLGYSIILYSSLPKVETLRGIKKYPELMECLLLDSALLDKNEASSIVRNSRKELEKFFQGIKKSKKLKNFTYRGVPLASIAIEDLYVVLMHRGMQAALNIHAIQKCIAHYNVCAFIGMDNSVATGVWMDQCKANNIPSFFHFYNATLSPILYRMLLDSYHPTAWLLGGTGQIKYFKEADRENQNNFIATGDMFADTIVRCNKSEIRNQMRSKKSISADKKVAIILSCYIIADFTEARKKTLFQTVAKAVKELGMELVIKAHPNEELAVLEKQMREWDVEASIFHTDNIRDVFLAGDIVCMYNSEAAQQAMLVGVPVVSLVTDEMVQVFDKNWNYYSSGAVQFVPLGESPLNTIRDIIYDEKCRKNLLNKALVYTKEVLGGADGYNAHRFAEIVKSIVR